MDSKNSSKNISLNIEHTKEVINKLWSNASSLQKQQVVKIGEFADTKAVYYTRNTGRISHKMAKAFSEVFNVSMEYIVGTDIVSEFDRKTNNLDINSIPSDEESLNQYELLLKLQHYTKDDLKKTKINKIKVLIHSLL